MSLNGASAQHGLGARVPDWLRDGADWPVWTALVLLGSLWLSLIVPPTIDITWRLYLAGRMLDGMVLYRDVMEVNPPLWFWAALPGAWIAHVTGWDGYLVTCLISHASAAWAIMVLAVLSDGVIAPAARRIVLPAAALALVVIPVGELGQREQALAVSCLLWATLAAARIHGRDVPVWLGVAVGLTAAYGFALKHYFVLVPMVFEIALAIALRRKWSPVRPETLALGACALAYAVAVPVFAPDFLSRMISLVDAAYHAFGRFNQATPETRVRLTLFLSAYMIVPLVAAVLALDRRPIVLCTLAAGLVALGIMLWQFKGWRYHHLAAQACAFMVLALIAAGPSRHWWRRLVKFACVVAMGGFLWLHAAQPARVSLATGGPRVNPAMDAFVKSQDRDKRITILSTTPQEAFHVLNRNGRAYNLRHYAMWMLPGLLSDTSDPEAQSVRKDETARVRAEFARDVQCRPPDVLVGERLVYRHPTAKIIDTMDFVRAHPGFAEWMDRHYTRTGTVARGYPVWEARGQRPPDGDCALRWP